MRLFGSSDQQSRRRQSKVATSKYPLKYINRSKPSMAANLKLIKPSNPLGRAKKITIKKIRNYLAVILLLFIIVHNLIIKPDPQVTTTSTVFHSVATYQEALKTEYQSFFNRNKITINKNGIEAKMRKKFPEITKMNLSTSLFSQIPQAKIIIDGPRVVLNSGLDAYVINAQGVAVGKASSLPSASKLPVLIDQTNFQVEIGKQVLATHEVDFIGSILSQCSRSQVPVASLTLPSLAQELDLRTADKSYYVKFYLGGDPIIQIGQFLAARHDFDTKNQQPSTYLDVRVPGKVYYK